MTSGEKRKVNGSDLRFMAAICELNAHGHACILTDRRYRMETARGLMVLGLIEPVECVRQRPRKSKATRPPTVPGYRLTWLGWAVHREYFCGRCHECHSPMQPLEWMPREMHGHADQAGGAEC